MQFNCISHQEKWMENINLQLGRTEHMRSLRGACHA